MNLSRRIFYPLSLFIGLRYTHSRGANRFVSFISLFSIGGIALGVMALITVTAVMNGFEQELKQRILGLMPHAIISSPSGVIEDWEALTAEIDLPASVLASSPFVTTEAMLQSPKSLQGVMLQGIYPALDSDTKVIDSRMLNGQVAQLTPGAYKVILGQTIASNLNLRVGDKVRLMVTENPKYTPMGRMPRQRLFTVSGIFRFGSDVDDKVALIHGTDAMKLLNRSKNGVGGVRLQLNDPFNVDQLQAVSLPDKLFLVDWREQYGELFQAVKMEKNMMSLLLALIIAVAAFNILSALVMQVGEKESEVAILKTLGAPKTTILAVFMVQGAWSGLLGSFWGLVIGLAVTLHINELLSFIGLNLLATAAGGGRMLPTAIEPLQVCFITAVAVMLSFVSTLYPAWRAANVSPAEALSYE